MDLCKGLQREGGLSSAELLQSEVQLNAQKPALLELQRRLRQDEMPYSGEPIQNLRDARERDWINGHLKQLSLRSQGPGRVAEVLVNQGENVGPGTLLMRIEQAEEPLLWVYLEPKQGREARPGQLLEVEMPDGSWLEAALIDQADLAPATGAQRWPGRQQAGPAGASPFSPAAASAVAGESASPAGALPAALAALLDLYSHI